MPRIYKTAIEHSSNNTPWLTGIARVYFYLMEERSSIERLKKRLYSRTDDDLETHERRHLREFPQGEVSEMWSPTPPKESFRVPKVSLRTVLTGSAIFFGLSLVLSAFLLFQSSAISPSNIAIEVQGPAAIGGGEELTLQVVIHNTNKAALENAELVVEFPPGTRAPGNLETDQTRLRLPLGSLAAGDSIETTIKSVLFGEEQSEQTIRMYVEYRVSGSSATFASRDQTYPVVLTLSPLSVLVESIEQVTSGQTLEFKITVASNAESELKDVLLSVQYPFGFSFEGATPGPSFRNGVWELGDLRPEQKKVITLRGKMVGEDGEERTFRFAAGSRSSRNETELGTAFTTITRKLTLERPFIGVDLAIDGSASLEPVIARGDKVRADISWFNNLSSRIYDLEIEARIVGSMLDERSISSLDGYYDSPKSTIFWTQETSPEFEEVDAGGRGVVSFTFASDLRPSGTFSNDPRIPIVITIRGKRLSENNVPESIESSLTRTVKVASDLLLTSKAVHYTGPFDNDGPMPPQVGRETTYTIIWTVNNSSNPVSGVTVSAVLPSYVTYAGLTSPSSADVTFNNVGGRVVWDVGNLSPSASKEVAFQVTLKPSLGQVGSAPTIVGEQTLSGTDSFAGVTVGDSSPPLSTRLTLDPQFEATQDTVVE